MNKGTCISYIDKILNDKPDNVMRLYFVQKTSGAVKYRAFQPSVKNSLQSQIMDTVLPHLRRILQENELIGYNAVGVADYEIESIPKSEVVDLEEFLKCIQSDNIYKEMSNLKVGMISFYCVKIQYNGMEMLMLRQFTKMKKLRSGIITHFVEDELVVMDSDFLGIDEDCDILLCDDDLWILNHISLERIFNYRDAYKKKTDEAMGAILSQGVVSNIEQFAEDCGKDVRIMKRFTNIMSQGRLPLFFENYDKVEGIVNSLGLDIAFDEEGKIIYREKSQLYHIVNLMSDSYFKSLLADRVGVTKIEDSI